MLPPTLREKRHYLAIEVLSKEKLQVLDVRAALDNSVGGFLGSREAAKAGLQILELDHAENRYSLSVMHGILSVNRKSVLKVRAALALLKDVAGKRALCRVKGVSGTLKRLREKFLS